MTMKCTDEDLKNLNGIDYIELRINDSFKEVPEKTEKLLNSWVDILQERRRSHGVLVHCYGGENRSCLLAGMLMIRDGLSGSEVVSRILQERPTALYNTAFRRFLNEQ